MYPNFQARMSLIAKHLIDPLLGWSLVPGDLQGDSEEQRQRRRQYMNWLGEDVNSVMPNDFNEAQIELACRHAFQRIRQTAKTRHWPQNSVVVEAMRYGCEDVPVNPGKPLDTRPRLEDKRPDFTPIEELSDERLQAYHEAALENIRKVEAEPYKSAAMDKAVRDMLTACRGRIEREIAKRRAAREAA